VVDEVYTGGALLLHALRLRIGEENFFGTLRTLLGRYQYGSATTSDFIEVAEEVSGEGLQSFFDAWLHEVEPPLPDLPS
jgi:aminopeptidase N